MPELPRKTKSTVPSWAQLKKLPGILTFKERYWALVLTLLLGISLLVWISANLTFNYTEAPNFGGTYIEGIIGQPKFINPLLADTEGADADLVTLIYSGLLKYDSLGRLVPDLARDFQISDDGLTYTVWLRDDIQWHDKESFNADDVIFTVNAIQNTDNQSPLRNLWQNIKAEKINNQTVRFILTSINNSLADRLTIGILPEHLWGRVTARNFSLADLNLRPVGTGPYKFISFQKDSSGFVRQFTLEANKDFYHGRPYIDEVVLKFYESDEEALVAWNRYEVNGISTVDPKNLNFLKREDELKVYKLLLPRYFAVFLNQTQSKALVAKKVRTAINHATDKKSIVRKLLNNAAVVVNSPLPESIFQMVPENANHVYNLTLAQELLDEAGWQDEDGDGWREKELPPDDDEPTILEIKILVPNRGSLPDLAEILKEQWERIGIRVSVEKSSVSLIQQNQIKNREYEALIFGQALTLKPDPYIFWHSSRKKEGLNFAIYDNEETDKYLENIRETNDAEEYKRSIKEFQRLVIEDMPAIFLYNPFYLYPVSRELKGQTIKIAAKSAHRFLDIPNWYLETKRVKKKD